VKIQKQLIRRVKQSVSTNRVFRLLWINVWLQSPQQWNSVTRLAFQSPIAQQPL